MITALEVAGVTKNSFSCKGMSSTEMGTALGTCMVNFQNMWAEKKTINKLLDEVLAVALRLNLAPQRESVKQKRISETQSN